MKFNKEDIIVLLDNSYVQTSNNYRYKSGFVDSEEDVYDDLSLIEFVNPQVNSLRKLYVQLSPIDKEKFSTFLLTFLAPNHNQKVVSTVIQTLIHIGLFDKLFKKVSSMVANTNHAEYYFDLFSIFQEIAKNEWNIFTRQQVDNFYRWISDVTDGKNLYGKNLQEDRMYFRKVLPETIYLWKKLNIIKAKNLKKEIFSETSQEITTDEKALKQEFKRNNFPDYLSQTLDEIDLKISTANNNFDYKSCMGLIRSFSESLFKHIAESLDPKDGRKIDGTDSEKASRFFVEKKLISEPQGSLLAALRHFISNEGVHRLKSRPDDARLSRNMMIEVGLYLLLRLKDFKD